MFRAPPLIKGAMTHHKFLKMRNIRMQNNRVNNSFSVNYNKFTIFLKVTN